MQAYVGEIFKKNKYCKHKKNNYKFNHYKRHMRRKAIKDCLLSKCKPGAQSKEFFDAVGHFMNSKCRL